MDYAMKAIVQVDVKYLRAQCAVRYWEDATVDGVEDVDGNLIPLRDGDCWTALIDLETGRIADWPEGVSAQLHYKVCDAGIYSLVDGAGNVVAEKADYVPAMLCPKDSGYGDYVIMDVGPDGAIDGWQADLSYFDADQC